MKILVPVAALFVLILSVPLVAQESSRQDFDDFCKTWEGRWVCDRNLVKDEPGIGQKGDKFTEYADCKITHDRNAMTCTIYGGNGTGTWIVAYDAGDRKIKGFYISSGGVFDHDVIYKRGDKWMLASSGSQADGTKIANVLTITISDNGDTHTWTGTPVIGGEKTSEITTVYHRVAK